MGRKWDSVSVCNVKGTILLRNSSGSVQAPLLTELGVFSCVQGLQGRQWIVLLWKVLAQEAHGLQNHSFLQQEPRFHGFEFSLPRVKNRSFHLEVSWDFLYHCITAFIPSTHLYILAVLSRHLPHPCSCASLPTHTDLLNGEAALWNQHLPKHSSCLQNSALLHSLAFAISRLCPSSNCCDAATYDKFNKPGSKQVLNIIMDRTVHLQKLPVRSYSRIHIYRVQSYSWKQPPWSHCLYSF